MSNGKPEQILVVDDTPENLRLLSEMLKARGFQVRPVTGGKAALRAAVAEAPDLVLLDVTMPEMDGFEVCRAFQNDSALKDIPILFISALSDSDSKLKAFQAGGVDYVTKPFQIDEVQARVKTHLRLRQLQREAEAHTRELEQRVDDQVREISDSQVAAIVALAKLAESRDDDTGHHIERVQDYCRALAESLFHTKALDGAVSAVFVEEIFHSSALHDIGKVGIPDSVLLKPGKLTAEEFELMKTHSVIGADTLERARKQYPRNSFINMGISIARSHHERWDGNGYPDRLAGEAIPLPARIMSIADVYDALRSRRPYKEPFTHEKSRDIIVSGKGTQFDPSMVEAFLAIEEQFRGIRDRVSE